jgi:hypothetical protein
MKTKIAIAIVTVALALAAAALAQELKSGYGKDREGKPHLVLCKKPPEPKRQNGKGR